jgi:hypothetical protein
MARLGYFIRRRGEECSIVKVLPGGGEVILETGLTLVEAETLYFVCIGEPVHESPAPEKASADEPPMRHQRQRQLAFKFLLPRRARGFSFCSQQPYAVKEILFGETGRRHSLRSRHADAPARRPRRSRSAEGRLEEVPLTERGKGTLESTEVPYSVAGTSPASGSERSSHLFDFR